jgi:thiol-disulfide isomerase/thioredoxin
MKHLIVLFFVLSLGSTFAQGINFETSDFQTVLDKAKAENKLIFMDAYTTWCGPCKWMSKNVFTDENVGTYFNERFINAKIDMEKGEGIDLAKKYEVSAYPTLLFIDGSGELVHMSIGSRPADDFLDLGHAANDPDRQVMMLKKRFEGGEKSADFLRKYTEALTSAGMKNFDEVAQMYMDTQEDWKSPENVKFIFDYSGPTLDSKLFQFSLDNKALFLEAVGEEKYNQKVSYAADVDRGKKGITRSDVENLEKHYCKYFSAEKAKSMAKKSYLNELMYSKDPVEQEKFKAEIQLFLADKPDLESRFYNSVAWQVYEMTDDQNLLKKAAEWAQISIDGAKNSYNTDTMAAILFKLGDRDKARVFAIESIEIAKKEGNDYSSTEELLSKIDMK